MKLVVWKGRPSDNLVRVDWKDGDDKCAWLSVGWAPSEEDYTSRGIIGGENDFDQIAPCFVPDGCLVYAGISGEIFSEGSQMVENVQKRGLRFETPPITKSAWRRLFKRIKPSQALFVEANRDFVAHCFKDYAGWTSDSWTFLVSRTPLVDWARQLQYASRRRVLTHVFLEQLELFFVNRWEHGFELLSCKLDYAYLKAMARTAARTANWEFVEAPDSSVETLRRLKVW